MYHLVIGRGCCLHHSLRHGWVRMHGLDDLMASSFQLSCRNNLSDHFCHVGANHVRTKPLPVFCIINNFHKAFLCSRCACLA
jgi:hypothetical protein